MLSMGFATQLCFYLSAKILTKAGNALTNPKGHGILSLAPVSYVVIIQL